MPTVMPILSKDKQGKESEPMDSLRYPIGNFNPAKETSEELIKNCITKIENTPASLKRAIEGLTVEQLDTPYRPEGWTVRQVVHHIADSHMNAFVRFKLALTEEKPTVKTYAEERWAELPDSKEAPVEISLSLVEAIHDRWIILLNSLALPDFKREFIHPDLGNVPLEITVQLYAWHGSHHIAHITSLRERMKW